MIVTADKEAARQFDRFTTDVNAVYKRLKAEVTNLKKEKLRGAVLLKDVYIFWFEDEDGTKNYIA